MMRRFIVAIVMVTALLIIVVGVNLWRAYQTPFLELGQELTWLKANKVPMTRDELLPPIPANQNAAPLYEKAFVTMRLTKEDGDILSMPLSSDPQKRRQADWQKVRQILEHNRTAIAFAHQTALRQHLRMTDWNKDNPAEVLFPHFSKMRRLAQLIAADALLKKRDGDVEEAVQNCLTIFRMAKHPSDDAPVLIGSLVGMAIFAIGYRTLEHTLTDAKASPQAYRAVLKALSELDFGKDALRAWQGDRALFGKAFFEWVKTAPAEKIVASLRGMMGEGIDGEATLRWAAGYLKWRYFWSANYAIYLRGMRQAEEQFKEWLLGRPAPSQAEAEKVGKKLDEELWLLGKRRLVLIAALLVPVGVRAVVKAAQTEAHRHIAQVAIALRLYRHKHGRYPDSLQALVPRFLPSVPIDPFTGKPLQYRRTQKGFRVWSIGSDGKDESGLVRMEEHRWGKGDIVWEGKM